jgi:hypothetical protein
MAVVRGSQRHGHSLPTLKATSAPYVSGPANAHDRYFYLALAEWVLLFQVADADAGKKILWGFTKLQAAASLQTSSSLLLLLFDFKCGRTHLPVKETKYTSIPFVPKYLTPLTFLNMYDRSSYLITFMKYVKLYVYIKKLFNNESNDRKRINNFLIF